MQILNETGGPECNKLRRLAAHACKLNMGGRHMHVKSVNNYLLMVYLRADCITISYDIK